MVCLEVSSLLVLSFHEVRKVELVIFLLSSPLPPLNTAESYRKSMDIRLFLCSETPYFFFSPHLDPCPENPEAGLELSLDPDTETAE